VSIDEWLGPVTAIGWKAHTALRGAAGSATVLAPLSTSVYLRAAGEIVWLGPHGGPLHPRAILCRELGPTPHAAGDTLHLDAGGLRPWRAIELRLDARAAATVAERCRELVAGVARIGCPQGLGALLSGARPAFPLQDGADAARALARACVADAPEDAGHAALGLLGLGLGLTPSGDDYVGAAFFAQALLAPSRAGAARWHRAAALIAAAAVASTHPVSAALLGDLLEGYGHAPLHELAGALAAGPMDLAVDSARRLVRLGHSSGWDMLAGFAAGCGALG
jgi:uncharacterized protein DUF2877